HGGSEIQIASAEVSQVNKVIAGLGGVEHDEKAVHDADQVVRERVAGGLQIAGGSGAREIEQAVRGEAHRVHLVALAAANVAGIDERRVNDQLAAAVVAIHLHADGVGAQQHKAAVDLAVSTGGIALIDGRQFLLHPSGIRIEFDFTAAVYSEIARAIEAHANGGGIGAGLKDKIIFQAIAVAVIDYVDAGVYAAIADAGVV